MRSPCARSTTIEPMLPQPMTPSVLLVISTPMKRFFSHLPAWVEASACGICRASASISVMACSAVVIELPNGVFITMMPLAVAAANVDIVDADAGAADHLEVLGLLEDLGRDLGRGADGEAVEIADQLGQLILVAAELGLEIDLDAAILEDLDGGGGQRIGDENLGDHGASRRLRQRVPALGEGPVEPQRQRLDIGALDGRAAPDAQAGRRIAVGIDVIGDALLLQRGGNALDERRLRLGRQACPRPDRRP